MLQSRCESDTCTLSPLGVEGALIVTLTEGRMVYMWVGNRAFVLFGVYLTNFVPRISHLPALPSSFCSGSVEGERPRERG